MKRIKPTIATLLLTALYAVVQAQTTYHRFSMQQTLDYGLKNAVQVRNALLDIKSQEQTNREITAAAFPQINGSISTTYNFNIAVQTLPNFISPAVIPSNFLKKALAIYRHSLVCPGLLAPG
jgi:outer membrane protein